MSDDPVFPTDRSTEPAAGEGREPAPEPELAGLEDATSPESAVPEPSSEEGAVEQPPVEEPPVEESAAALLTDALEVGPGGAAAEADGVEGEPAEDELPEEEVERVVESPYDRAGQWYVVHTYAGYENKVKSNLESRISSMNMEDRIYEVVIPMED